MAKMVALKRLRFPRGVEGKELMPGDEFETNTDRETFVLLQTRQAKAVEGPARRGPGRPRKVVEPVAEAPASFVAEGPPQPVASADEPSTLARAIYRRRDMTAEE